MKTIRFIILLLSAACASATPAAKDVLMSQRDTSSTFHDVVIPGATSQDMAIGFDSNGILGPISILTAITDGSITLAKMANLPQSSLIGRYTASTGVPQQITVGSEFTMAGGSLALANAYQLNSPNLTALAAVATNGGLYRTGSGSYTARTITGTASQITVTNGDGVSGAPGISLPANVAVTGSLQAGLGLNTLLGNGGASFANGSVIISPAGRVSELGDTWVMSVDGSVGFASGAFLVNATGDVTGVAANFSGQFNANATTDATTAGAGSMHSAGGIFAAKKVIAGTTFIAKTAASPSTTEAGEFGFKTAAWAANHGALQLYDGTANTYVVAAQATDTPTDGQVPMWNAGGIITWENAAGSSPFGSAIDLSEMANLAQSTLIGRATASTGIPEAITIGPNFSVAGSTLALVVTPQPLSSELTSIAALSTTTWGRGFLDDANAAATINAMGGTAGVWGADLGGTGRSTLTSNGVLYGVGSSPVGVTTAGSAYQPLRVPSIGGAPAFGALDVSQSAAVTGVLGVANGGTGTGAQTSLGATTALVANTWYRGAIDTRTVTLSAASSFPHSHIHYAGTAAASTVISWPVSTVRQVGSSGYSTSVTFPIGNAEFDLVSDGTDWYLADSTGSGGGGGGSGTVTSVSFTGGLISVATSTTTPALTVVGTSGGVPYFNSSSTWTTSAALASGSIVVGGGVGGAPATITTGTGVTTALGVNPGSAGSFVVNGGALGTPASGSGANLTAIPEGGLTLTDITTNNAATTKHGFLKKLSNSASQYMDGTGNWSTPTGGTNLHAITFTVDGAGSAVTTGVKLPIKTPYGGTLTGYTMMCSPSGSVTFNIFRAADGAGLPTASIINSAGGGGGSGTLPAIASGVEGKSTTFTSWGSTTITAFDNLALNLTTVDSVVTKCSLVLYYQ